MKKRFKKWMPFLLFGLLLFVSFPVLLGLAKFSLPKFGQAFSLNGWLINTVERGTVLLDNQKYKIEAHGVCKELQATDGKKYFIPTRSTSEWLAFLNNKPGGVKLKGCGCKIRYKIATQSGESDWIETPFSSNGEWAEGGWAIAPDGGFNGATRTRYRVSVYCDGGVTYALHYRYRGNHGPYNAQEHFITSTPNRWVDGPYTSNTWKDCDVKGGSGVCGFVIEDANTSSCITEITTMDNRSRYDTAKGYESDKFGATIFRCPTDGCRFKMRIKCN